MRNQESGQALSRRLIEQELRSLRSKFEAAKTRELRDELHRLVVWLEAERSAAISKLSSRQTRRRYDA